MHIGNAARGFIKHGQQTEEIRDVRENAERYADRRSIDVLSTYLFRRISCRIYSSKSDARSCFERAVRTFRCPGSRQRVVVFVSDRI